MSGEYNDILLNLEFSCEVNQFGKECKEKAAFRNVTTKLGGIQNTSDLYLCYGHFFMFKEFFESTKKNPYGIETNKAKIKARERIQLKRNLLLNRNAAFSDSFKLQKY